MYKVLGPFLMNPSHNSMGFWLQAEGLEDNSDIEVLIEGFDKKIPFKKLPDSLYGIWLAQTSELLKPSTKYNYSVFINQEKIDIGLSDSDFTFRTLQTDDASENLEFAMVSCNGIEEFEHKNKDPKKTAWSMWERLYTVICNKPNIAFLIMGGDQVYMDDEFDVNGTFEINNQTEGKRRILSVYRKYWDNIIYRKVMARIPSFLMWDDHDLIDGFGSRPEQFDNNGSEKPKWSNFRNYLTRAFYEFQACRNPNTSSEGPFTFSFDFSQNGFLSIDLRSERNHVLKRMLTDDHKKKIGKMLDDLVAKEIKNLFLISSVTFARMGGKMETSIGRIANYLWNLSYNITLRQIYGPHFLKPLFWSVLSSLTLLAVQFRHENISGHAPAFILFAFCLFNLVFDLFNNKDYLSFWPRWILRVINSTIVISVGLYYILNWHTHFNTFVLKDVIASSSITFNYYSIVIGSLFCSVLSLYYSKFGLIKTIFEKLVDNFSSTRKKISLNIYKWGLTLLSTSGIIVFFLTILRLGIPGRSLTLWSNGYIWLPMILVHLLGIIFYLIALLEAGGLIDLVAGLDDDVKDSWSSEINSADLVWLAGLIKMIQSKGIKVTILSGDIHTGGLSKLSFDKNFQDQSTIINQIVSSPISYVPMAPLVEKLTSESSINTIIEGPHELYSFNLFYKCQRNFVVIQSNRDSEIDVEFHFEDIIQPEKLKL